MRNTLVPVLVQVRVRLRRRLPALFSACLLLSTGSPVLAQALDTKASVDAGTKALLAKDYATAIVELETARQQGAGAAALVPLAQAYEGAGKLPEAYVILSELGPNGEQRLKKLEPELGFVSAQVAPSHATLSVDDKPMLIDPKSRQIVVTAGQHVLSARADGFAPAQQSFQVERGTRSTVVSIVLAQLATVSVRGFAPDAVIAVDGIAVGAGLWAGSVAPGQHLVQVYKPGGPSYDFPFTAVAGQTVQLPPPDASAVPPVAATPPKKRRWEQGLWLLGQLGFFGLTASPDGFEYDLVRDDDSGEMREGTGAMWWVGATGGYRVSRGFGVGGLLMYGRGGGTGTFTNSTGGDSPANFTLQFVRLGPHVRFMAGGDRARFLTGVSFGGSYQMVDLVDHEAGLGPFWGFDLGAEFNPGDHMLLGVAFDVYIDRTSNISGDPYGGTVQGYLGLSARVGFHDWKAAE